MDRSWMYDRVFPGRSGLKWRFVEGVEEFLFIAKKDDQYAALGGIRCPCLRCSFQFIKTDDTIRSHLYKDGFTPDYFVWTRHGEVPPGVLRRRNNVVPVQVVAPTTAYPDVATTSGGQIIQPLEVYQGMISHAVGVNLDFEEPEYDAEEVPNEEAQRFYMYLSETNKPLFEGSTDSKLSVCVRLLGLKSQFNVAELCMEYMTRLMLDTTTIRGLLPQSYYDAKRLVSKLGLKSKRIDCCVYGCMLYYSNEFGINDGELSECKVCGEPRYRASRKGTSRGKRVPQKAMFYLPLIPRLQRMFTSLETAGKMTWHHENRNNSGVLRHPCDGEAWKHFDRVRADFARDPRNVRLGLCSDGFTPYIQASATPYSCWPVIVTPYNLPPEMCMSKPYMFLNTIIPGPTNPTAGIDIYLQPLIDDLKRLWHGVVTYDASCKQNFVMRVTLMWTINDFPAYGMLSGWGTHGKMACPVCMVDTKAFTLKYGGKTSYFDCHHRFLPPGHPFRRSKTAFIKGKVEMDGPPRRLTPEEVWDSVKDIPPVEVVAGDVSRPDGYGQWHNWTKKKYFLGTSLLER